jgi:hypothetical protein
VISQEDCDGLEFKNALALKKFVKVLIWKPHGRRTLGMPSDNYLTGFVKRIVGKCAIKM